MKQLETLIKDSIREDIGSGDITSKATVHPQRTATATISAKEEMVLAGGVLIGQIFKMIDKRVKVKALVPDGKKIRKGTAIAALKGPAASLLSGERTALNFLQHLSGIATLTDRFVSAIRGSKVLVLDTRKTTPAWRFLEKYAVRAGGGMNHRTGLYDMYLIKNNHVDMAGSVTEAVLRAKHHRGKRDIPIEVEVRDINELNEAVTTGADVIMLDNFSPKNAKKAIDWAKKLAKVVNNTPKFEISGGINLKTIKKYVKTGADFISVGALTHSAKAADIHMIIE